MKHQDGAECLLKFLFWYVIESALDAVFRIRNRKIRMILGLQDPDPSINKQKKKNLDFCCFVTSQWRFVFKD
jgi:hypothetical protein